MSTHPCLPLWVDDFEAATAHLSPEEDGVYNRLLRLAWRTPGCSLPTDHAWIARKVRMTDEHFERVGAPLLKEFFRVQRGRYVQRRLRDEYDTISRKKSARQNAGKKGGVAKAAKTLDNASGNASGLPSDTRAFLNHTQTHIQEEEGAIALVVGADAPADPKGLFELIGGDGTPPDKRLDERRAFDSWNELAGRIGLPIAKSLSDGRRKAIKARLRDGGLSGWMEALAGVEASQHCRGENDRGWRADLDFVCQAKSFNRLREGAYGTGAAAQPAAMTVQPFPNKPLRDFALAEVGGNEGWVRSWLDSCGWDEERRAILCPRELTASKLRETIPALERRGVVIVVVEHGRRAA